MIELLILLIFSFFRAPTAAAELLNNRIKEVANHTQKLRSKKATVKKPNETNLKKNDSSKIKRVLKKNDNNAVKLIDKNLSVIKETAGVSEINKTDKIIPKNITILSPHSINLKAERQLNNLIRKNGETKESLIEVNIANKILPTANTSSEEPEPFSNETPSINTADSVNINNKKTEPTNINSVFRTNPKITSSEKNENSINNKSLNINFEVNYDNNDKVCKEKSHLKPMSTLQTKMHCTVQTEAQSPFVILENSSDNSLKNLVSDKENICDSNFQENRTISISFETSTVETQSESASNDFVINPVFIEKTTELENLKQTETHNTDLVSDETEKLNELIDNCVNDLNSESVKIINDVSVETVQSGNGKNRKDLNELSTQNDKTEKSKLENQFTIANDVSVQIIETVNSNIKNVASVIEISNEKKTTDSITSQPIEIIEKPEGEKQPSIPQIATPMEVDIEPETSSVINEVSNFESCQIENEISADVEIQSNDSAAMKRTFVESAPTESSNKKNSKRIYQSVNSNFVTSTPNKINETKLNEDLSELDSVNDAQVNREKVSQDKSPIQINLEEHFIEVNDEEVISKPASTMLNIKEKMLHAENIINQVMLKLSKGTNIKTMISHKKSFNNNENCAIPSTSNGKNLKQLEKNAIFNKCDDSGKSNKNENPRVEVQKNSSQNVDNKNHPKNIETIETNKETLTNAKKEVESNEKFENDCLEISRDSEHSTLLEEIALLELANAQEVPNKISYKSKKVLANTEKYPKNSSEDVVRINFPRQNSKKKASQSHEHVSHIKINLPEETGQSFKSVWGSQSRTVTNLSRETARPSQKTIQSLKPAHSSEVFQSCGPIRRKNKGTRLDKKSDLPTPPRVKKFDRPYESVLRHLNTPRFVNILLKL